MFVGIKLFYLSLMILFISVALVAFSHFLFMTLFKYFTLYLNILHLQIKRCFLLGRKVMINLESILKSRDITLPTKVRLTQGYGFSSSQVYLWELDYKESWVLKNWCFCTVVVEKTLESPLHCKEIQPVHPKGDQSWLFIGRTDVEAETPILWPPDVKSWLFWKDPDSGKDWGQEEKGTTEVEMIGWHHLLSVHELG